MPLVKIEARRGASPETKRALLDAVHAALVEVFKIPDRDRHQRFVEYAPEDFEIPDGKSERFTIVEIDAFAGRSLDAKRALYQEIVTRFEAAGVPKNDVMIVLRDVPRENWGLRGGRAACDVDLGFEVQV